MQETIYTLALYDAFREESECPLCLIEEKREEEALDYLLHEALMDDRTRGETNREGFCRCHFELMYRKRAYRLQLALLLDTHLAAENARLKKLAAGVAGRGRARLASFFSWGRDKKKANPEEPLLQELRYQEKSCYICRRIHTVMEEHIKVMFYLWEKEREFATVFAEKKGFCQKHFRQLLERAAQYLSPRQRQVFITRITEKQLANLERIQSEVHRFTEKMSYHNEDLPWDNARDALIRGIKKLAGICRLE
ncbi:MAG: ABC transporter substrate-binding protein [Clostridia bacterium]|nr:ABC transporter substrate-binding protein [Clostridia bacterium]